MKKYQVICNDIDFTPYYLTYITPKQPYLEIETNNKMTAI